MAKSVDWKKWLSKVATFVAGAVSVYLCKRYGICGS